MHGDALECLLSMGDYAGDDLDNWDELNPKSVNRLPEMIRTAMRSLRTWRLLLVVRGRAHKLIRPSPPRRRLDAPPAP